MSDAAERLILERVETDFDAGLAYTKKRLRESTRGAFGFLSRPLEAAVLAAISRLELRPRLRQDTRELFALAKRVDAGEPARQIAEANVARLVRLKDLSLVARVKDPEFYPLLARATDILERRLPDIARMVATPDPKVYDDILLHAFPERSRVLDILEEQRAFIEGVISHVEKHPNLLRLPPSWVPRVIDLARDIVAHQHALIVADVEATYLRAKAP